jgi:8-oxo-dGTP pyrophosphatase MutT (NUDIX family)
MVWNLQRPAARVVLLDPDQKIFLMNGSDPIRPEKGDWWEIPGGGIEPGETSQRTAARELYEECGFSDIEMGPCIWTQYVEFDFAMYHFKSDERIHLARTSHSSEWNPQGLEALEAAAFDDARWWSIDELVEAKVKTLPERLLEFLPRIINGDIPSNPIDISPKQISG